MVREWEWAWRGPAYATERDERDTWLCTTRKASPVMREHDTWHCTAAGDKNGEPAKVPHPGPDPPTLRPSDPPALRPSDPRTFRRSDPLTL